jgi:hypothetical protein
MSKHFQTLFLTVILLSFSCRGTQGPGGPAGGDTLTDPNVQPRVVFTLPPSNGVGPFQNIYSPGNYGYPHFIVRFNKYMRTPSVEGAVSIEGFDRPVRVYLLRFFYPRGEFPEGNDEFYDDLYLFGVADSLSYFTSPYRVQRSYTVHVSSGIEDINGNRVALPYSFTFTPEPYFRIANVSPKDQSSDVAVTTEPVLYFNSPVDSTIFTAVQLSPPVAGEWELSHFDSTSIYFELAPNTVLLHNQTYTISVNTTARDKYGNQLPQSFLSRFSTTAFRISSTYPFDNQSNVNLTSSVCIATTGILDTGSIRQSFSISPSVQGTLQFWFGDDRFSFYTLSDFTPLTTYTVTLSTGLRTITGTNLQSPHTFSFRTQAFQVSSTTPHNGATNVPRNTSIWVYLNTYVDTGSVRSAFNLPGVAGSFSLFDGTRYFSFYPASALATNTNYTVTISTLLRSKSGSNLTSPYTFSFVTEN